MLFSMATAQSLLTDTEAAIQGLLDALADEATQEYSHGSRSWKRADFPGALKALRELRKELREEVAANSHSPIRFGTIARTRI